MAKGDAKMRKKRKKKMVFKPFKKFKEFIKIRIKNKGIKNFIISLILIILIAVASICLAFALYIIVSAPNFDKDLLYSKEATVIYDVNGEELARIGSENRELVTYGELPQVFVDALIATEDSRFFQHNGLDIARFVKASIGQVAGSSAGGASTITMQLVKNVYTDSTSHGIKGIIRKFTDIYMAVFKIENCYTKEEIMEFYVNSLWLGNDGALNYSGIYGVETASNYYFGKSVSELTLAESSLLVGMYQNARLYNPYRNPVGCRNRQKTVLKLMVLHGYITQEEMDAVLEIPIQSLLVEDGYLNSSNENQAVIDYIINDVIEKTGQDPRNVPMKIYSTIDPKVQKVLIDVENGDYYKWKDEEMQEGIAITSVSNGSITALSGGRNYKARGLNRATDVKRQPGSSAKPLFDYAPHIEYLNSSPGTYFFDDQYTYSTGQTLNNSDNKFMGMITMRTALALSRNIPALQAFHQVSRTNKKYIEDFVHSVGIDYGTDLYESASIGGFNGVSPLQMSAAYGVFARGGYYIEPYSFTKIEFENGTTYDYKPTKTKVLSAQTAYLITSALTNVLTDNNYGISVKGTTIAGKTGTTNIDSASREQQGLPKDLIPDMWFITYNSEYSIGLWIGYDKNNAEHYLTVNSGYTARTTLMRALATHIYSTNKTFSKPSGISTVTVEKYTYPLQLASKYTPDDMKMTEIFKEGTEPTEVSFRYEKLATPTNAKSVVKNNQVTLTWNEIATPKAIDNDYLLKYFQENYGQFASKYYEQRINENAQTLGTLGYQVYLKGNDGSLIDLGWHQNATYTQSIEKGKTYTFIIKASYSIFKNNASEGLTITVKGVNPDNEEKEEENLDIPPIVNPEENDEHSENLD